MEKNELTYKIIGCAMKVHNSGQCAVGNNNSTIEQLNN
jgi:hypothetical protein